MMHKTTPHWLPLGIVRGLSVVVLALLVQWLASEFTRQGSAAPTTQTATNQVTVWLGPAETLWGPDQRADNAFHTVGKVPNLLAYIADVDTFGFTGNGLNTLQQMPNLVLTKGNSTAFDSCGAWLNSALQDGPTIRGWYHAETDCAYPATRKSVAYAESIDGGHTFTKVGYPNNQVITAPPQYTDPEKGSEGDHHVIRVGDYYYLYFVAFRDPCCQIRVARSLVTDGGRPGTWWKYYNDKWDQPGLGGDSSPIAIHLLARSWIVYNTSLKQYIGFSYFNSGSQDGEGLGLAISSNGVTNWQRATTLVISATAQYWNRTSNSPELLEYPSLIGLDGDSTTLGTDFWLYYMQLRPGEDFKDGRYLVRRAVHIALATATSPFETTPHIALSRYVRTEGQPDTWVTTSNPSQDYQLIQTLGYVFVGKPEPNALPVYDCYLTDENDHLLDIVPTCGAPGNPRVRNLRQMGWISTIPFSGSQPIYRCYDPANHNNHFVSTDEQCEGKTFEWRIGYIGLAFADVQQFRETGQAVSGSFLQYWQNHGGLAQQGFPISPLIQEVGDLDGKPYTVQYFERAVFEQHPENTPPYDVLLSQLGTFQYHQKYPAGTPTQQANTQNGRYFSETGHTIGGAFRAYWESHGGLAQQGYPLSDEFQERSDLDGKTYTVQYFERAVFEYHPENQPPYDVLLSRLGTFRYQQKYPSPYSVLKQTLDHCLTY